MKIVVLTANLKIIQPFCNGTGAMTNIHGIVRSVSAGMADPLTACYKLPLRIHSE
ncbi:hypothetical protein SDC9_191018 [bioreactor metagenome]|uniref:Uncharacterized protein n=1 Tax=bioreactor metagenome TaxID=1076179 RepID=A0A645HWR3_9ZZZZ